jgi:hypothetical protein
MKLVWLVPGKQLFEYDWIHELFPSNLEDVQSSPSDPNAYSYEDPIYVFNHSIDYETFFASCDTPYAAVHLSDETLGDTAEFYKSPLCRFIVRTYIHPLHSNNPKVVTIGLGYRSRFTEYIKDKSRYYHWNFAGNIHDQHRNKAVQMFTSLIPYQLHTTQEGFNSSSNLPLSTYVEWMCSSKFTLCPVGQGNLDSFRVYEACEAGSIPIVLGNTAAQNYHPHSYWKYMFPIWFGEIPFVIGNTMEECLKKVQHILQDPSILEQYQQKLGLFWKNAKTHWKQTIKYHLSQSHFNTFAT